MTSQTESLNSPLYKKEQFEREIIQWRLLGNNKKTCMFEISPITLVPLNAKISQSAIAVSKKLKKSFFKNKFTFGSKLILGKK